MRYYATASGQKVREAMRAGLLGQINTPAVANRVEPGVAWVADNGCFSTAGFTMTKWFRWLLRQPRTCDWAAVPDVVGDHAATLARWHRIAPLVARNGFPPAFVCQDGCTPDEIPADAAAVFIGGTTAWKESAAARACVTEAHRRGITAHMGRVNTRRRLRIAAEWGVDSCDGTLLAFGPDYHLPRLLAWLNPDQASLFGVA